MGISHIEDLSVTDFINSVRNLNEFDITEKIDGFNLRFGVDEKGFYSTGKDDNRKYKVSDYGEEFRYSGFKAAHMAFARVLPTLLKKNYLNFGDEIEVEVLYGAAPNTVPYSGNENKIVILKKKKGSPNIRGIRELLHDQTVTLKVSVPKTKDGRTIHYEKQTQKWVFAENRRVEPIRVKHVLNDNEMERLLSDLENFLSSESGIGDFTNAELIGLPLNRKPDGFDADAWKSLKDEAKLKREKVRAHVMSHKLNIKDKLLDKLVRDVSSQFGPDDGWIEGLVFSGKSENEEFVFKLVDKDMFTALNKFNWHVRKTIGATPNGVNSIESITGLIIGALARKLGHPELGTKQKTRYINKNKITVQSLANEIEDFHALREEFIHIIEIGLKKTEGYHQKYEEYKNDMDMTISMNEKNLEAFAELYQLLDIMKYRAYGAKNKKDLVSMVLDPRAEVARSVSSMWS